MAIVLNNITSGYNLAKINANFQNIEDYINDKLLARADTGVAGEAMMERDLDMNGNEILNYPVDITNPNSLVTKAYVDDKDLVLQSQINKALRFEDDIPQATYGSIGRANSLQGYNNIGKPVPIFSMTETADLALKLASNAHGLGASLVGIEQGGTVQEALGGIYASHFVKLQTPASILAGGAVDYTEQLQAAIDAAVAARVPLVFDFSQSVGVTTGGYIYVTKTINITGLRETRGQMCIATLPSTFTPTYYTPETPPRGVVLRNQNATYDSNGKIYFSSVTGGQSLDTIEVIGLSDYTDDKIIGQLHTTAYTHFKGQLWSRRYGTCIYFANTYDCSFAQQVACTDGGSINYDALMVGSFPYADQADESNSLTFPRILIHSNKYRDAFIEGSKITIGGIHGEANVVGSISGLTPKTRDGFAPNGICSLWIALTGGSIGNLNYNIRSTSTTNGCVVVNMLSTYVGEIYTDAKSDVVISDVFYLGRGGTVGSINSKSNVYTDGGSALFIGSLITTGTLNNAATRTVIEYALVTGSVTLNAGTIGYLQTSGSVTQNQFGWIRGGSCSGSFTMTASGRLENFTIGGAFSSSAANPRCSSVTFNGSFTNTGGGRFERCTLPGFAISTTSSQRFVECNITSAITVGVSGARAEFETCSVSSFDFSSSITPIIRIIGGSSGSINMSGTTGVIAIDLNHRITSGVQITGWAIPTLISGVGYGTRTFNPFTGTGYTLIWNGTAAQWVSASVL